MKTNVYSLKLVKDRTVSFPIREASDPKTATTLIRKLIADAPSEHMVVVFLDAHNQVIGTTFAASGGSHGLQLRPKDVFRAAIVAHASAIILGHNHPSGDPTPSGDDLITTHKLIAAGKMLGIPVVDHIVVTMDQSHSMLEHVTLTPRIG